MDNFTPGSIIEPRAIPTQQPDKTLKPKIPLIIAIVEVFIIVALAIVLIITTVSNAPSEADNDDGVELIEDEPVYILEKNEATVLMYMNAIANNNIFNNVTVPNDACTILQKIYNSAPNDDSNIGNPCVNGKITVFSNDKIDSDLAARGVSHVGIVIGDSSYNYFIYSDYSAIEYLSVENDIPAAIITFNIGT